MTTLRTALGVYPHTAALRDGSVVPTGFELEFVEIEGPIIAAFRRMVRGLEFDVSEMAITTYLSAKEYGKPFTAIPIFPAREFPQRAIVCNVDAGITSPKDLEGRRVGVRAYTVTTGVWARGVLATGYGVDLDKVTWVIADEEHVKECALPGNVEYLPGADLSEMVVSGELPAGIGVLRGESDRVRPLLGDVASAEREWLDKTGVYPINHTVVVADSVLAEHPEVARSLVDAFVAAKAPVIARMKAGTDLSDQEKVLARRAEMVGGDPLPYGIEANRPTLEAIVSFAHDQHILSSVMPVEAMFVPGVDVSS